MTCVLYTKAVARFPLRSWAFLLYCILVGLNWCELKTFVLFIGCPFISPDFNSLNSSYRLGAAYGYGYLFRVMVRDRAMDRDRVRIQIQQVEIRQNEKEPFIVIAYCSLMILTVMWLGFFHIKASRGTYNPFRCICPSHFPTHIFTDQVMVSSCC